LQAATKPDGLSVFWTPQSFKNMSLDIKGLCESWAAPVAKIVAPSGFGEEVWQTENPVTVLGVRLAGVHVRRRDGRSRPQGSATDVALMARGAPNEYLAGGSILFAQVNLSDALIDRAAEFAGAPKLSGRLRSDAAFCESEPLNAAAASYVQRALITRDPPTSLEMEGRALLLLDAFLDWHQVGRAPGLARGGLAGRQLRRVAEFIDAHLEQDLMLDDLAALVDLSPKHFARAFRQSTGAPPHRWLIERRIERAKALLSLGDDSLAHIALACGFADQSHFTAAFRKCVGVTPGCFRRELRG
jgi:AraC family transcriptional regulator